MDERWGSAVIPTLTTRRLVLEPLRIGHAVEMTAVLADASLYDITGGEPPTPDELADRYRRQVAGSGREEETWLNWVVRRRDSGDAVGFVQATVEGDVAHVAWLIGVREQGRRFAREAAAAMIAWLGSQGVAAIRAHIAAGHVASERVAESIGLRRSGEVDADGEEVWSGSPSVRPD